MLRIISLSLVAIGIIFVFAIFGPTTGFIQPPSQTQTLLEDTLFASSETIYFWRIVGSESGIYFSRDGQQEPQAFAPLAGERCTGCHVVSNQSGLIAAVLDSSNGPIVIYDLVSEASVTTPSANGSYLAWSPDGRKLAISYNDQDIYVIDLDTQSLTPLTGASDPTVLETMPAWAPDGTKIAFVRSTEATDGFMLNGDTELAYVPVGGGLVNILSGVPSGQNYYPTYSPDGRWLAFTHHNVTGEDSYSSDAADIYILPLSGGEAFSLASNSASSDSWPSWSADSDWLAFNSKRDGQYDIYATYINSDGQSGEVISFPGANTTAFEHLPAWGLPPEKIDLPTATASPTGTPLPSITAIPQTIQVTPTTVSTATFQPPPLPISTPTPLFTSPLAQVCLTPIALPCAWFGLPWWVCLLWLLTLLLLLLLLWRWRKAEVDLERRTPAPPEGFIPLQSPLLPPLPNETPPGILLSHPITVPRPSAPSMIIGVGPAGLEALQVIKDTLIETYDEIPAPIHLLGITTLPQPQADSAHQMIIPIENLDQRLSELSIAGQALPEWAFQDDASDNPSRSERTRQRLAMWLHARSASQWLRQAVERAAVPDHSINVYLVVSTGQAEAAALIDLVSLLRQQADELAVPVAVHGFCILAAPLGLSDEQNAIYQQNAFAFWRELERFQSAFDSPYPFDYPDIHFEWCGKLFDRLYHVDSVGEQYTYTTTDLYHSIADALMCWLDPLMYPTWLENIRPLDSRLHTTQNTLGEPLYSSLGTFVYILPIEILVKIAALRFAHSLLASQAVPQSSTMREEALRCLEQTHLAAGGVNTQLIQDIAHRARTRTSDAMVSSLGIKVAEFISPDHTKSASLQAIKTIYTLFENYIIRAIPNSREYKAPEYNGIYREDIRRFFDATDSVLDRQLGGLNKFLEESIAQHNKIFARILQEKVASPDIFAQLLKETIPGVLAGKKVRSAGQVIAFLDAMRAIIHPQLMEVDDAARKYENDCAEREKNVAIAKEVLEKIGVASDEKRPSKFEALIKILAIITNESLWGILSLFFPNLAIWFAIPAVLGFGLGSWETLRKLYPRQKILVLEENYKAAKNEQVIALLQARLYRSWAETLQRFEQELDAVATPFHTWVDMAARLDANIEQQHVDLTAHLQSKSETVNRYYFNQPQLIEELYQRHLANETAHTAARQMHWSSDANGRWALNIVISQSYSVIPLACMGNPLSDEQAQAVVLELCTWFADSLRQIHIAQVIAEHEKTESALEKFRDRSVALIHYTPEHQPDLEIFRFLCLSSTSQDAYFEHLFSLLQKNVSRKISQKRAVLSDPYRAVALSSTDMLRRVGITPWRRLSENYANMAIKHRPLLHVFPAERNAACVESALYQLGVSRDLLLSPSACLALQDLQRARLFWLAYALGIITETEEVVAGSSSERSYIIKLPGGVEHLTIPRDEAPSLWLAVTAYVLGRRGGPGHRLEEALLLPADASARIRVRQLEEAISKRAALLISVESTQELGWMMRVFLEDEIRRLEGIEAFL